MKNNYTVFAILLILGSCTLNRAKIQQNSNSQENNNGSEFQLHIYEVLRHSDPVFAQILEKLPPIHGFKQIIELDYQNYPDNIAGVTDDPILKSSILEQVNIILNDSLNIKPLWSKYEIENRIANEIFYQLYFLKINKQILEISSDDISEHRPEKSSFNGQSQLLLQINDEKAKKWNQMTTKAAVNNNGYLAFVIEDEVYSSVSVLEPIVGNKVAIPFKDLNEAQSISNTIK